MDELFIAARQHLAAAAYAGHALPFEIFLLAMLLEQQKKIHNLSIQIEKLMINSDG